MEFIKRIYPYAPFICEGDWWEKIDVLRHEVVEAYPLRNIPTDRLEYWIALANLVPSDVHPEVQASAYYTVRMFTRELARRGETQADLEEVGELPL